MKLPGIDAGTTSVKSGLFNADGQCLAVARQEYQNQWEIQDWCDDRCLAGAPHHQALTIGYLGGKTETVETRLNLDGVGV
jgi:glycerol kinase